jgi:hypothetical protein
MSMTTAFKCKKTKKDVRFITQQYECGLYVAIYHQGQPIPDQTGSTLDEAAFHKKLRKHIAKVKDTFLKDESDPVNLKEVRDLQTAFAKAYCEKKGWPCKNDNGELSFRNLGTRRLGIIKSRPEFKAFTGRLVW